MKDVKILDCTLRDGGYLNNWSFKEGSNILIENTLLESNIDFVESGFLTTKEHSPESTTLYNTTNLLRNKIVMVNFGEYDLSKVDNCTEIRLAFKRNALKHIEKALSVLNDRNIKFSLNPMHISLYNKSETDILLHMANKYLPTCVTAVDTMGIMTEQDTNRIFKEFDNNKSKDNSIGFHSHDNLGLSFKNTLELLSLDINRTIIIDSSLYGIGRGGGMLSTNTIADYLNKHFRKNYNTELLDKIANKYISQYTNYDKTPYYLTAKNKCHPYYGKFLSEQKCTANVIEELLEQIPTDYKTIYNNKIIEEIYKKNFLCVKEV